MVVVTNEMGFAKRVGDYLVSFRGRDRRGGGAKSWPPAAGADQAFLEPSSRVAFGAAPPPPPPPTPPPPAAPPPPLRPSPHAPPPAAPPARPAQKYVPARPR